MERHGALRFVGGRVLGESGLEPRDLVLRDGVIGEGDATEAREVRLPGLLVLPGLVDLHGDGFERQLAPRRGMVTDLVRGLFAVETDLASAGITTAWLAQFWSWEGGMRGPEFAQALAQALEEAGPALALDLRLQLRLERSMVDDAAKIEALLATHAVDYLVFNDHLPYDRLDAGRTPARLAGSAGKAGRSPEAHLAEMQRLAANRDAVSGFVAQMVEVCAGRGVRIGSHDDTSAEERVRWGEMGADIAEFPVARAAAEAARARGEPVILGSPNIVRGGSHKRGGMAAEELVADGLCDALASDYHYPAMAQAAFGLAERGVLPLPEAWRLVSRGPAEIMGLTDRGWIAPGLRADLVLIEPGTKRVVGVCAKGRPVFASGAFAEALVA